MLVFPCLLNMPGNVVTAMPVGMTAAFWTKKMTAKHFIKEALQITSMGNSTSSSCYLMRGQSLFWKMVSDLLLFFNFLCNFLYTYN